MTTPTTQPPQTTSLANENPNMREWREAFYLFDKNGDGSVIFNFTNKLHI
jgi:Ca2+-binding EF-hand superfamily protein